MRSFKNKPVVKKFLGMELKNPVVINGETFDFLLVDVVTQEQTFTTKERVEVEYVETTRKPK